MMRDKTANAGKYVAAFFAYGEGRTWAVFDTAANFEIFRERF
jgi:hypothetical protein